MAVRITFYRLIDVDADARVSDFLRALQVILKIYKIDCDIFTDN